MILTLIFASLVNSSYASGPCGGAQVGFWTNPDASRGGSVATTAKVQGGAFIAPGAQVCESAQVKAGAKILDQAIVSGRAVINAGAEISGRAKVQGEAKIGGSNVATKIGGDALVEGSAMVTGNTQVIARAKVRGSSKVHNAVICQASLIEGFDVVDSDYYCQTEDPEPAHPGELGKKTLLGVDSDRDGVRDDVEIFINDLYSNIPIQKKEMHRLAAKIEVSGYAKLLKRRNEQQFIKSEYKNVLDSVMCNISESSKGLKNKNEILDARDAAYRVREQYFSEYFNTRERLVEWNKVLKSLNGTVLQGNLEDAGQCASYLKKQR